MLRFYLNQTICIGGIIYPNWLYEAIYMSGNTKEFCENLCFFVKYNWSLMLN